MNDSISEFHYRHLREPHTIVECKNGELAIVLFEIKEMKMEVHLVEDESCLTVRMKDGACTLFFDKHDALRRLAETFANQVKHFVVLPFPNMRYATMPRPIVTITGPETKQ